MKEILLIHSGNLYITGSQVRITEADNTAQYWPNLGSQQSAIVIGPVSPFASVKCWADEGGLVDCLNWPTFSLNLAQYRPYTKPILTFTMSSSSESRRARFRPMNSTLLGHVSLLPRQTTENKEFGKAMGRCCAELWPNCGRASVGGQSLLSQNCAPSAYRIYHSNNGTILDNN